MLTPVDLFTLVTRPDYYLQEVNLDTGEAGFLQLDEGSARRSAFMDHRVSTSARDAVHVSLALLLQEIDRLKPGNGSRPINYILHSAFCCSTLISRCLDIEHVCCAMREPAVLMQMANYKRLTDRYRFSHDEWRALFDAVLFLLAKCGAQAEAIVIKPTNAANNLSEDLLEHPRTGGVVLLHSSLEQFLVSILKKGEAGRNFVRRLFNVIQGDSKRSARMDPVAVAGLTDLQIATFVWYMQMDVYLRLLTRFPRANIRTLDCEAFLAQPEEILMKLCGLFALTADVEQVRRIVAGPLFRKSSKDDTRDYDAATRKAEYAQIMRQHAADISAMLRWSEGIRPEGPLNLPLPAAL